MTSKPPVLSVDDFLSGHVPHVVDISRRLQALIREAVPAAVEKVYPTWQGIGYTHPNAGYFCAIFPQAGRVRLGFEWGVLLPDPANILSGSGTQMRFVDLSEDDEIPADAIRALIAAAIALPGNRKMKMWLVQNKARPVIDADEIP